mgnify:CR=1 FL=1
MKKKVAIQGIAGSYHDIAARNYFEGEEIEIIGCNTFRDVISTIKKILPFWDDGDRKYD